MGRFERRRFILGLDLGQVHDFSALTVLEQTSGTEQPHYLCNHLYRWPLGVLYSSIVGDVQRLIGRLLAIRPNIDELLAEPPHCLLPGDLDPPDVQLAIDVTGVGMGVVELFLQAELGIPLWQIMITGGEVPNAADGRWRVPKKDLAGIVAVLLQQGRLQIVRTLPLAETLSRELKSFKAAIGPSGHVRFGNDAGGLDWRSAANDDMVLSLALACWVAERGSGTIEPIPAETATVLARWYEGES